MSFTLNQPQDSTFNTQNWQEVLNQAPRRYKTNGGTAIRRGDNYFIKTNNGYKESIPQEEWQEGYMRTKGYRPVFNDETGEISGYETTKYQPELVTSRMTGQPVKTFQSPDGPIEKAQAQDLSDREVFNLMYDPANAPSGVTKIRNSGARSGWDGYGGELGLQMDSLGTDGSKWRVDYSFMKNGNQANVSRYARQTNADEGQKARIETRTSWIPLTEKESVDNGDVPFPASAIGYWKLDKQTGKLYNIEQQKQGGYLRLQKQGGKLTEVWTPFN